MAGEAVTHQVRNGISCSLVFVLRLWMLLLKSRRQRHNKVVYTVRAAMRIEYGENAAVCDMVRSRWAIECKRRRSCTFWLLGMSEWEE